MASPDREAGGGRGLGIFSRTMAAVFGGYALAAAHTAACSVLLPGARAEAVLVGMLSSFFIYAVAFVWAFSASSAGRAWLGILLPALSLAGAALALSRGLP